MARRNQSGEWSGNATLRYRNTFDLFTNLVEEQDAADLFAGAQDAVTFPFILDEQTQCEASPKRKRGRPKQPPQKIDVIAAYAFRIRQVKKIRNVRFKWDICGDCRPEAIAVDLFYPDGDRWGMSDDEWRASDKRCELMDQVDDRVLRVKRHWSVGKNPYRSLNSIFGDFSKVSM